MAAAVVPPSHVSNAWFFLISFKDDSWQGGHEMRSKVAWTNNCNASKDHDDVAGFENR